MEEDGSLGQEWGYEGEEWFMMNGCGFAGMNGSR